MLEFEILASGLYRSDQLEITYDPTLSMPITPAIQEWIDTLWQQKLAIAREKGFPLFDAPLFRLITAESRPDGTLHLVLGNTSYKEYVTTRVPEFAQKRTRQELSNALSVCSVVETSDGYILLDKRQGVDVYNGRYHVIGGFFERELDMTTHPDPFQAIRREIREETGIQSADIREQFCLGVVYDLATPHGEICFLTHLNIPITGAHGDADSWHAPFPGFRRSIKSHRQNHYREAFFSAQPNFLSSSGYAGKVWQECLDEVVI
jgi:hypothetical protein